MKLKNLVFCIIFSLTAAASFAGVIIDYGSSDEDDDLWGVLLKPEFGIKSGSLGEYVFLKNPEVSSDTLSKPDDKLSYLEWEVKPEYYAGFKAEAFFKKLYVDLGFTAGIPGDCGNIYDYDWRNISYNTTVKQQAYCTNYSYSNNHLDSDFSLFINAGYSFKPWSFVKITPSAGYEFSKISFSASDGEYWYGKDIATNSSSYEDENKTTGPFYPYEEEPDRIETSKMSGTSLEYSRQQSAIWLGADFTFILPAHITVNAGAYTAPFIYTYNEDYHPQTLPAAHYVDICNSFFSAWKFNLGVQYLFTEHLGLSIQGKYSFLTQVRGESYGKKDNENNYTHYTAQEGGAESSMWQGSLSFIYKL